ncbi:MAG: 1-acyl-sn-glycerol-3-phosphate acyltransferase [Bdellovibrionaceae bacterium]|jgi:1-acyl-sn-glycerol-3-phosphate acyltransferase|nr:1-acyl-sn-glycerol-3-phosphate acyltransferase [Pseudobdellovibrionaceae bacterium]
MSPPLGFYLFDQAFRRPSLIPELLRVTQQTQEQIATIFSLTQIFGNTLNYYRTSHRQPELSLSLKQQWAADVLSKLNIQLTPLKKDYPRTAGTLWLGNHISYLDIPLLLYYFPHLSFVAKAEVRRWPVIGAGARHIGVIFVNRSNKADRSLARERIKEYLASGHDLVIFPSGTTRLREGEDWRLGAFEIAHQLGCWVQGFCISYQPLRPAAYIGDDILLPHMLNLLGRKTPIRASLTLKKPFRISHPARASQALREWCLKTAKAI